LQGFCFEKGKEDWNKRLIHCLFLISYYSTMRSSLLLVMLACSGMVCMSNGWHVDVDDPLPNQFRNEKGTFTISWGFPQSDTLEVPTLPLPLLPTLNLALTSIKLLVRNVGGVHIGRFGLDWNWLWWFNVQK
jgi:hypothetical protein